MNIMSAPLIRDGVIPFIPEAWALLVQQAELAERYRSMFDTVIVDEYQDVNQSKNV